MEMDIHEYVKRRDAALLSLDKEKLVELFGLAGVEMPESDRDFWGGVHIARLQVRHFSDEVKAESLGWLHANGFAV